MPHQYSLPVIHPSFELLKRAAPLLHFIAATVILINGLHHFQMHHVSKMICYCQFLIAADVYLLLFFITINVMANTTYVNCIFRFIEALTLLGISYMLVRDGHALVGWLHLVLTAGFAVIFYREYRIQHSETVDIRPTGVSIPNFVSDTEISWHDIKLISPNYHSILIETFRNKKMHFQLRQGLNMNDLQQIDTFCRQHQLLAD